jgi:hypothetical protein
MLARYRTFPDPSFWSSYHSLWSLAGCSSLRALTQVAEEARAELMQALLDSIHDASHVKAGQKVDEGTRVAFQVLICRSIQPKHVMEEQQVAARSNCSYLTRFILLLASQS